MTDNAINDLELGIDWIENIQYHHFPGWLNITNAMRNAISALKEKQGEWLEIEENIYDCSICGAMAGRKCLYCPGCGAKMTNGSRAQGGYYYFEGSWYDSNGNKTENNIVKEKFKR